MFLIIMTVYHGTKVHIVYVHLHKVYLNSKQFKTGQNMVRNTYICIESRIEIFLQQTLKIGRNNRGLFILRFKNIQSYVLAIFGVLCKGLYIYLTINHCLGHLSRK